jgi:CheY-like chemotaxis protein
VVDDEPMVARFLERALSRDNDVTVVGGGASALERLREDSSFDVVLCDLMMPGVTGIDIYETLVAASPELAARLVFITGGTFTARARQFLEQVPNPHLEKPLAVQELRALVSGRVAQRASAGRG